MRGGITTLTLATALLAVTLLTPTAAYDWTKSPYYAYYEWIKPRCENAIERTVRSCFDGKIGWYSVDSHRWDFVNVNCRADWNGTWCYFIVSSADKLGLVPDDRSSRLQNSYSSEWSEAKNAIVKYLIVKQEEDGHWEYSEYSCYHSYYYCKAIDTARAILILLDTEAYKSDQSVQNAIKRGLDWLFNNFILFGSTTADDLYAQSMSAYAMLRVFNLEVVKGEIDLYQDDSKFTQNVKGCVKTLIDNLNRLPNPWSVLWDVNGDYTMSPVWTVLALAYAYRLSPYLELDLTDTTRILKLLNDLVDKMTNNPRSLSYDLRVTYVSHAGRKIPVWQVRGWNGWQNDPYCTAMAALILEIVKWFDIPITVSVPNWYVDYLVDWLCYQQKTDDSKWYGWWDSEGYPYYYHEGENMTIVLALAAYVDPKKILGEIPKPLATNWLGGNEYHAYVWDALDALNNRPATVSMWRQYLDKIEQDTNTGITTVYFKVEWDDYFETPFAHDILGRVVNGTPVWSSVDSNPTLLGILESDGRNMAVTCDGSDAYLDDSRWPTRDVDGDGLEDPTVLWTAVGIATVPFLLQPRDRPNALLLAEKPKAEDRFEVRTFGVTTTVDLSKWRAYVKLHLPKVRARAVYLLYTVCGPAGSVTAKVHVRYEPVQSQSGQGQQQGQQGQGQQGPEEVYEVKLLDWCTLSIDPDELVVDVNRGVGLTLPDRLHFIHTPHVERKWVQIYATRIPVNPSRTLDQLWLELEDVPAGSPCYVWLFALTIERDNDYLLVLGPDRWISIPKDRTPRFTVTVQNVRTETTPYLRIGKITMALSSRDEILYLDMDRVELRVYGIRGGESEDIEIQWAEIQWLTISGADLPDELLKRLKDYRATKEGFFESYCEIENLVGRVASGASSQDVTPIVLDVRVWSWDVIMDNQGALFPVWIVVTPGFTLAFSGYPITIDEKGSSVSREYYCELGDWGLLVARLKLTFSKSSDLIKVRRVLVRAESADGKPLYVRLEPVQGQQTGQQSGQQGQSNPWWDELRAVVGSLASNGEPVGRNNKEYLMDGASLDSGSGEFESPIELRVLVTGSASALREGVRLVACLAGSYGAQSNEVEFSVDLSDVPRIEKVKLEKQVIGGAGKLRVDVKLVGQGNVNVKNVNVTVEVPDQQGQGLTQVQVSKVAPEQGYTHGFEADIGDSVLAVVTVDVSGTDYRVEHVYVWPYDVYLSGVRNVRLSYENGTALLSADVELTRLYRSVGNVVYEVVGKAAVMFDGEPVLSGVSWQSGSHPDVTEGTITVPVETGEHEVMVVFSGELRRDKKIKLADLECVRVYTWKFGDVHPPTVESPSQVLYDRYHDLLVIAAKVKHANVHLILEYNESDGDRLTIKEDEVKYEGSNPRIVYGNVQADSFVAGDWVVGVIDLSQQGQQGGHQGQGQQDLKRLKELVKSGGVARFSLVEDLGNRGEIRTAFDVLLSSVSWVYSGDPLSGGEWVCVDVLPSQSGRGSVVKKWVVKAWKLDVSVDNNSKITNVRSLKLVGEKVLEGCVEPEYVGDNLVVCTRVVGSGKGASYRQECAKVTVDVNNETVDVRWLSVRQGVMVGSSYLVLVFREGDDVVVVVASPDEKRRLVAERLNVQGVRSVSVFGPLVGVETQGGVEWHWVTQAGVDSGVSVQNVLEPRKLRGAGKLVVLKVGTRKEYLWVARSGERYRGYDVWLVYGPKGRVKVGNQSGYLFVGRIGAVVWVGQQDNLTGVSVVVGGTRLWDSGEEVLVLDDGRVLYMKGVIKGQGGERQVEYGVKYDVFKKLGVSGGAVVDVGGGVALYEVNGRLEPVLLLKDGVRRVDAWDGKVGLGAWRNPSGEGVIVVQADVSGKRLVCVRLLKEAVGDPVWVGEFGGEWFLVTREGGVLRAYGLVRDASGRVRGVVKPVWSGVVSGRNASVLVDGRLVLLDGKGAVVGVFRLPGGVKEVRGAMGDVLSYVDGKGALRAVWVTSGGLVSPVASVEGGKVRLVVFGNGGFAVLGGDGKVVRVGTVEGFKRVVAEGDGFVVCETSGGLRLVTLEGSVVGPKLQGWSVDGRRVFVFEVGGKSVVVGEGGTVVGVVPGRPVLLEGGVLVTSAGAWWVTSGGLARPERVSGGQARVVGRPVSASVRSLGGGGGGRGGPVIPVLPPVRRRRRTTA